MFRDEDVTRGLREPLPDPRRIGNYPPVSGWDGQSERYWAARGYDSPPGPPGLALGPRWREVTNDDDGSPEGFVTKDSGTREEYTSGMVRDTEDGKARFDLMLPEGVPYAEQFLTRIAELLARGAEKYGDRNWEKGTGAEEMRRARSSANRHFMQWMAGETDEDHAAAVFFNLLQAETLKHKMRSRIATEDTRSNDEGSTDQGSSQASSSEGNTGQGNTCQAPGYQGSGKEGCPGPCSEASCPGPR